MPTAQDILATKGTAIYSTTPQATVLEAVQKMNQHKLGALVVMEGSRLVGMFTERDVLRRVVNEERDPRKTLVADVMTREIIFCPPDTDMEEISSIMKQRRIRHLPVCDDGGNLHGLISIGDVNAYHSSHQEAQIVFLNEYLFGRA